MTTEFSTADIIGYSITGDTILSPFSSTNVINTAESGSISVDTSINILNDINQFSLEPYITKNPYINLNDNSTFVRIKRKMQDILSGSTTSLLNISNDNGLKLLGNIAFANTNVPPFVMLTFTNSEGVNIVFPQLINTVNTVNFPVTQDMMSLISVPNNNPITAVSDYPPLPLNITGASVIPLNNGGAILIGGKDSSGTALDTIYQLLPNSTDGSLEWSLSTYTLPVALYDIVALDNSKQVKAVYYETVEAAIILIGGNTGTEVVDTIYMAPYSAENGLTGDFTTSTILNSDSTTSVVTFPVPITKAYAFVDPNGNIIVAGGTDGTTDYDTVYYATDASNYTYTTLSIGGFTEETYKLPFSGPTMGAIGNNDTLYLTNSTGTPGPIYYFFDSDLSGITAATGTLTNNLPNLSPNGTLHVLNDVLIYAGYPNTASPASYELYMSNITYSSTTSLNSNSAWVTTPVSIPSTLSNLFAYQFFDSNLNPNMVIGGIDSATNANAIYSFSLKNNLDFSLQINTKFNALPIGFYLPFTMYVFCAFSESSNGQVTIPSSLLKLANYVNDLSATNGTSTSTSSTLGSQSYNPADETFTLVFYNYSDVEATYQTDSNDDMITMAFGGFNTGDQILSIEIQIAGDIFDPLISLPAIGSNPDL